MSRVQTTWYGASPDTQFQWATTDNDLFDRELDLYRLAQALELHTHEAGKGLPVGRLADLSIITAMYGLLSIPTGALQDLSVTTAKLAAGAVTDAKMDSPRVLRTGDTMTGALRNTIGGGSSGTYFFGSANNFMTYTGTTFQVYNSTGGGIELIGDLKTYRTGAPTTGYVFLSTGGQYLGFDGVNMVANYGGTLGAVMTTGNTVGVPLGACCFFRLASEITAAGAHWARESTADGRLLVGAGTTAGVTFVENTFYGTNWQPASGLTLPVSMGTAGAGVNNVVVGVSLAGTATNYLPPALAGVWGKRIS